MEGLGGGEVGVVEVGVGVEVEMGVGVGSPNHRGNVSVLLVPDLFRPLIIVSRKTYDHPHRLPLGTSQGPQEGGTRSCPTGTSKEGLTGRWR